MPWVETQSLSFTARHDSRDADAAARVLEQLEDYRGLLAELFPRTPGEVTLVLYPRPVELALAHPWLPLAQLFTAPAGRRYFTGWFGSGEIYALAPRALEARASEVPGSREALVRAPLHEYAHLVVGANNPDLPPPFERRSLVRYLRWAWLAEGAASYLSGQVRHLRPAIARRLREGPPPRFPPSVRDAPLLGGTVFSLLERGGGREACAALASRLDPGGPAATIERAFMRPGVEVERDWRAHLKALAASTARPTIARHEEADPPTAPGSR